MVGIHPEGNLSPLQDSMHTHTYIRSHLGAFFLIITVYDPPVPSDIILPINKRIKVQ